MVCPLLFVPYYSVPYYSAAKLAAAITGESKNALYERALAMRAEIGLGRGASEGTVPAGVAELAVR